jgi:hypothetical protein
MSFDHYILEGNATKDQITNAMIYYRTLETQPPAWKFGLPALIAFGFLSTIISVIRYRKSAEIVSLCT